MANNIRINNCGNNMIKKKKNTGTFISAAAKIALLLASYEMLQDAQCHFLMYNL